ncbi:helix-turn-helix domain-containing protein [Pediococcus pentosaceus]|uniref:helix-turn-helix domain-containing protein n=1 Tax=Pediococcus pentosaceus TaxID=1255 RepID=UPI0021A56E41|nr:helix-turn-helix domain-containing protein [Pediococcus pentosaceus]MCT3033262.1 helix-turn-helix domain-containing protein [Pediococcus pentosaceus]
MQLISENIRQKLLKSKGITLLKTMADNIGISTITLRKILTGEKQIVKNETYLKIIHYLKGDEK